ncbi:hypothetical protein [Eubacterium oxidoreducens]|uniref:Uncharacterized protein n=1 Tax=Eubacterium oxidoreducens TaxID=1732 RepID=A0A1G6B3F9_EUBOX|nr:hypothetical protein [Eubacterium oxidoreducens]SDB15208.1 hypothetical protein SAMN02910417_01125 [Eubacterium oxidoreducens]
MKLYGESIINSIVDIYRTSPINPNYPHGMDCKICEKAGIECYADGGDGYECNTGYVKYLEQKLTERKQPTVNAIPIPEGATNGDVVKLMFPDGEYGTNGNFVHVYIPFGSIIQTMTFDLSWWNAPYRKEWKNETI